MIAICKFENFPCWYEGIKQFLPVSGSGSVSSPVEGSSAPCPSPASWSRPTEYRAFHILLDYFQSLTPKYAHIILEKASIFCKKNFY